MAFHFLYIDIPPIPPNLQDAVAEFEGGQEQEETDAEDLCPEIVEQSHLDHFLAVLQNAQRVAALAEKGEHQKRRKPYDGRSKTTQKRRRKQKKDLAKQGYLSVFEFMEHVKEKAEKRLQTEEPVRREAESGTEQYPQELEESSSDTKDSEDSDPVSWSVSRHVGNQKVRLKVFLMWSG
jgi:hypothetical protein